MNGGWINGHSGVQGVVPLPAAFEAFPRDALAGSIPARFAEMVRRYSAHVAVRSAQGSLTYAELAAAADRVADAVHACARAPSRTVVVLCEQQPMLVVAILGVLSAARAYVPLDPTFPERRLARTIERSGADVIVADRATMALALRLAGPLRQVIDASDPPPASAASEMTCPGPGDLAYIYFTSGSTGEPKGVFDNHRNVLHNVMRYTNTLGLHAGDRMTLLQRPAFSGAVSSLFGALLNGGTSCLFDLNAEGPARLRGWLAEAGVTVYHSVPSIFRAIAAQAAEYRAMRVVRLEGDRVSRLDLELFARHFDERCVLVNGLGATECGLVRQFPFRRGDPVPDVVPIGYPVADMQVFVADEHGREVPAGTAGEIVVRSAYLALGYWDDPSTTATRFLPAPGPLCDHRTGDRGRLRADGCLEHLGRVDLHPRFRGAVVEVEAIERALLASVGVAQAAVAVQAPPGGPERLIACVVPVAGANASPGALRAAVAAEVPSASVPDEVIVLDALPIGENGKVDLRRLLEARESRPSDGWAEPRTPVEIEIAEIWAEVLGCAPVARDQDFRVLGGDSLAAAEVLAELRTRLGLDLPDSVLADAPTVAALAEAITRAAGHAVRPPVEWVQEGGTAPPLLFATGDILGTCRLAHRLARSLTGARRVVAISPFDPQREATPTTVEAMAALRLRQLWPSLPDRACHVAGYCSAGGLLAYEIARQIEALGRTVLAIVLIDTFPLLPPGTGAGPAAAARRFADRALRLIPPLRRQILRARRLPWVEANELVPFRTSPRSASYAAFFRARAVYEPGPVRAPVHVLWPVDERYHPPREAFVTGWRRVSPDVHVTPVPGDHATAVGMHMAALARALGAALDSAPSDRSDCLKSTSSVSRYQPVKQ